MYPPNYSLPPAIPSSTSSYNNYNLPPYYYYGSSPYLSVPPASKKSPLHLRSNFPEEFTNPAYRPHYNSVPFPYPSQTVQDPPPVSAEEIYQQHLFYNQWAPPRDLYYEPNYLHSKISHTVNVIFLGNIPPKIPVTLEKPPDLNPERSPRFMLVEQPEESQRKAYKTENK
jgi:hypothetical protein